MGASLHTLPLIDPANLTQPRKLAYYQWGDPKNPRTVVCVHGLSRNARDFDFLAEALAPRYRIIAIDMAGRGKSDWLTNKADYNYFTYVADTVALLNALQLSQVTFIGTSMGGIIGMMLAAQQPARIARLVLNDVGAVVSAAGLKRILGYVGASGSFSTAAEAMAYLKIVMAPFGITDEVHWRHLFDVSFNLQQGGKYVFAYDPDISAPFKEAASKADTVVDIDLSALWNAILCPVLILRGGESDILTRAVATSMCKRAMPTSMVEFPGVGHAPALLDEAQIRTITDWLN